MMLIMDLIEYILWIYSANNDTDLYTLLVCAVMLLIIGVVGLIVVVVGRLAFVSTSLSLVEWFILPVRMVLPL